MARAWNMKGGSTSGSPPPKPPRVKKVSGDDHGPSNYRIAWAKMPEKEWAHGHAQKVKEQHMITLVDFKPASVTHAYSAPSSGDVWLSGMVLFVAMAFRWLSKTFKERGNKKLTSK